MPGGLHMDDIVRAAVAAYSASQSSSRDRPEYSSRSHTYDRDHRRDESYSRDRSSTSDPDPFSELVRRGAQELGRLIRKFEKKSKSRPVTGQDIYDDRFVEELGSDVEPLPEYYPEGEYPYGQHMRDQGRAQTIHVHHRDEESRRHRSHSPPAAPRRTESYPPQFPQYMPHAQGHAAEYYTGYTEPSYVEQPSTRKEKKKLSLKSLTKSGLDLNTLLKNLPVLLERADRILSLLDGGSRSRSGGSKKMNYITALRAAVKLVRALQIGAAGMSSSGARR